ncbi:RCC1 domain-containing protein [Cohnella rhizosphaerae]|uniref:RCC1 repeat-containing protein n=1 Tax=Cohnella rhizosphaerae TaxID=1457232 RepID=A0A9X4KU47_9BACL|nr:RCC1 domain-containing protein [Cohnella rhizosphaerae]MDG0811131.1 hypothetical protein [Cohnella rhizosphaerae]
MFQSKRLYHFVIFLILSGLIPIPSTVGAEASSSVVIAQIAASPLHALVLTESGEVYGWGSNANGALGDGTDEARTEDLTKAQGLPAIKAVSTGYLSSYALTNEGELYAWGRNYYGQLGGGGASWGITLPRKIEGLPKLVQIEGGNEFAVALAASGGSIHLRCQFCRAAR